MTIFLMIMLGCKVRQQKPSCMVSFCWTKPRTLQAGSTVLTLDDLASQLVFCMYHVQRLRETQSRMYLRRRNQLNFSRCGVDDVDSKQGKRETQVRQPQRCMLTYSPFASSFMSALGLTLGNICSMAVRSS